MMESCEEELRSVETDTNIMSFMGNSELNFGETSMIYDSRPMLDLVRSAVNGEEGLEFHSAFQPTINGHNHNLIPSCTTTGQEVTPHSPPLLSMTSVSSASTVPKVTSSPQQCAPFQALNSSNQRPAHQQLPLFNINLNSSQNTANANQELSSSSIDEATDQLNNEHNSSGGMDQSNLPVSVALHTPPLQQQDFSMYYSEAQSPVSVTISRNYGNGGNGSGIFSANGYLVFNPFSSQEHVLNSPQQPNQSVLSPNNQQTHQDINIKREKILEFPINRMKVERNDIHECNNVRSVNQPPYSSFANLDLNREEKVDVSMRLIHNNIINENGVHLQNSLLSPIRSPNAVECSTPNNQNTSTPRGVTNHNPYEIVSPPPPQMVLGPSHLINRPPTVPVHLQQHLQQQTQHQQHLFQSIPLHNPLNNQNSPLNTNDSQHHPFPLTHLNSFDEAHHESLSNASRNLSFNYSDAIVSPNGMYNSNILHSHTMGFLNKNSKIAMKRSNNVVSSICKEEEAIDSCTSDSLSNESDDESLVIDTSALGAEGFECGECKTICRTRGGLRKHLAQEHLTNEPEPADTIIKEYSCPLSVCNFGTTLRDELDRHIAEHINDGWTPTGKKRHNKNPLQRHRYNKEEFQCPHCDYSCTVEKAFNRHLSIHEAAPADINMSMDKVSCQICGKDRPNDASLRLHMKKHRKGKFYKCDICKFKSVQLKKLIQHRRMHTGEKPHLCPYCVYRAARRDNLRSHVRRMHKKDNMFSDTFTPRPLLIAQVDASVPQKLHGKNHIPLQQNDHHMHNRPFMPLSHHPSHNQMVQQMPLLDRIQHHHQHQQQISPQPIASLGSHGINLGALSPIQSGTNLNSADHVNQGLIFPTNNSQHNSLLSPQGL